MARKKDILAQLGPPAWANWKRFLESGTSIERWPLFEANLYSDQHISGGLGVGVPGCPYQLLHAFSGGGNGPVYPRFILRVARVGDLGSQPEEIGGVTLEHEIAALLSLEWGTRVISGSRTRHITPESPLGSPRGEGRHPGEVPRRFRDSVVPGFLRKTQASDDMRFMKYHRLDRADAAALVRAATSFSEALWICESSPELAWLLLVSALECVARRLPTSRIGNIELPEGLQGMVSALGTGEREVLENYFREHSKLALKFSVLIEHFLPEAPEQILKSDRKRPSNGTLDWNWPRLKPLVTRVYEARSNRLHAGTPFPSWMCLPPRTSPEELYWEYGLRPAGSPDLGQQDLTLNTFVYLARGTILNWWDSLSPAVS